MSLWWLLLICKTQQQAHHPKITPKYVWELFSLELSYLQSESTEVNLLFHWLITALVTLGTVSGICNFHYSLEPCMHETLPLAMHDDILFFLHHLELSSLPNNYGLPVYFSFHHVLTIWEWSPHRKIHNCAEQQLSKQG